MKALSLKQPFAELVATGKKKIELRKWKTNFRGEFLIHASKTPDEEAMKRFGFGDLPTGCIVGKAVIVGVKKYSSETEHLEERDLHLANSSWGNYGFIIEKAKKIEPIYLKGRLNFWETNLTLK